MKSGRTPCDGPTSQDVLATLQRVYGGSTIQRDPFGRRAALPSEIARVLAQHATEPPDPSCVTAESGIAAASSAPRKPMRIEP